MEMGFHLANQPARADMHASSTTASLAFSLPGIGHDVLSVHGAASLSAPNFSASANLRGLPPSLIAFVIDPPVPGPGRGNRSLTAVSHTGETASDWGVITGRPGIPVS